MPSALAVIIASSTAASANLKSWLAYFTGTIAARGVASSDGFLYATGNDGTKIITSKYNTNGSVQWQKGLDNSSATGLDVAMGAAADSVGNVYGSGYRALWKYNASGSIVWQKNITSTTTGGYWFGIRVDASGNIYSNRATSNDGGTALTTYKIDSTPAITWQKTLTASGANKSWRVTDNSVAVDSSGNVYVIFSQYDEGIPQFDHGLLTKYDSSGTIQWTRKIVIGIYGQMAAITIDSAGNIYVSYGSGSTSQRYLSKFNSSGTIQWSRELSGGTTGPYFSGLATDSNDNVYAVGRTLSSTNERMLIVKYNSSGTIQFQRTIIATLTAGGAARNGRLNACSIDVPNGFIVISGILDTEFFTARLPIDGSKTGSYSLGTYTMVYGASSLTDASASPTVSSLTLTPTTPTATLVDQTATDATSTLTNNSVEL